MVYTNDEGDKSARQRNFFTTVYLLPVLTAAIICAVVYWATRQKLLTKADTAYGYIISLTIAMFVFAFNRRYWLKMPDGSYHNIKGIAANKSFNLNEPTVYEAEFFYSKKEKATTTATGAFLVAVSVWLGFNNSKTILIPIMTNISGLFLLYAGLKGLLDKSAQLKIAKNGLWTKKSGFVNWGRYKFCGCN